MGSTSIKLVAAALAALTAASALPGDARADDLKKQCVDAYTQAQVLRKDRRWQSAMVELEVCAQAKCPLVVRRDCSEWKKEITAKMPTVIFVVRDASGELAKGVRVLVDGKVLREDIDETPVNMDPGEHVLRYEQKGAEPIEQSVQIREGDKERRLSVAFAAIEAPPPPPPPPPKPPVAAYVLGGVGVAGLVTFTALGVVGKNERDDLASTCAPGCPEDAVSSIRTKLLVADISLAVGVASLGVATFLVIRAYTAKPEPPPAASAAASVWFAIKPLPGGGFGQIGGSF